MSIHVSNYINIFCNKRLKRQQEGLDKKSIESRAYETI